MKSSFFRKVSQRESGLVLYGLAPPKRSLDQERLLEIAAQQQDRIERAHPDAIVVYDIQEEVERTDSPRPFPFLPTVDPESYAGQYLGRLSLPKVVYRSVGLDTAQSLEGWLRDLATRSDQRAVVLVGAATAGARVQLRLSEAYEIAMQATPELVLGGIAIAERHARRGDEHQRIMTKMRQGCRFFVTQAVYDVTASKSLVSDYAIALAECGEVPAPLILTFSPCASIKTLAFMKWLGISFPRWLENELTGAPDPLATSLDLCEETFEQVAQFARHKGVPIGINIESVSIRKVEIEASMELLARLRAKLR